MHAAKKNTRTKMIWQSLNSDNFRWHIFLIAMLASFGLAIISAKLGALTGGETNSMTPVFGVVLLAIPIAYRKAVPQRPNMIAVTIGTFAGFIVASSLPKGILAASLCLVTCAVVTYWRRDRADITKPAREIYANIAKRLGISVLAFCAYAIVVRLMTDLYSMQDWLMITLNSAIPVLYLSLSAFVARGVKHGISGYFFVPSTRRRAFDIAAIVTYAVGISYVIEYVVAPFPAMILVGAVLDFLIISYFYRRGFWEIGAFMTLMFSAGNLGYALDGYAQPGLYLTYLVWAMATLAMVLGLRINDLQQGQKIVQDAAALKASQESLRVARAQEDARKTAIGNLTHDLRTPIAAIDGLLSLQKEGNAESSEKLLAIASDQIKHLGLLVDDLLEVGHAELGAVERSYEDCDLAHLVSSTVGGFEGLAERQDVQLIVDTSFSKASHVLADSFRVRRILQNLVDNAIKYSKAGTVSVALNTRAQRNGTVLVKLTVTDTGPGIAPEHQSDVFEKFKRGETFKNKPSGQGLGLTIVRQLAEAIDAKVIFDTKPGSGSTFGIEFSAQSAAIANHNSGINQTSSANTRRILVAEDDPVQRLIVSKVLAEFGEVVFAMNGAIAVEHLTQGKFDLVLMDCRMPVLDGYAATKEIRQYEETIDSQSVPIVGVTANATSSEREQCMTAGMNEVCSKPLNRTLASKLLEKYCEPAA